MSKSIHVFSDVYDSVTALLRPGHVRVYNAPGLVKHRISYRAAARASAGRRRREIQRGRDAS